jgi:hypothetical protein
MSFVIGMATGYETRKLQEVHSLRQRILASIKAAGIRLTDRAGRVISPEDFLGQILGRHSSGRTLIISTVVAVVIAAIAITTGIVLWQII